MQAVREVTNCEPVSRGSQPELNPESVVASWDATAAVIKEFMVFADDFRVSIEEHRDAMVVHQIKEGSRTQITRGIVLVSVFVHVLLKMI